MKLPASLFEEITGYTPLGMHGQSRERRKALRIPLRSRVVLCSVGGGRCSQPDWVRVRDISVSGIGILHNSALAPGAAILVGLPRNGRKLAWVYGFVVRCQCVDPNLFLIGIAFSCILELQQTLSSQEGTSQPALPQAVPSP